MRRKSPTAAYSVRAAGGDYVGINWLPNVDAAYFQTTVISFSHSTKRGVDSGTHLFAGKYEVPLPLSGVCKIIKQFAQGGGKNRIDKKSLLKRYKSICNDRMLYILF